MTGAAAAELPMTGYDTEDRYFATQYTMGGRRVYNIDLSFAAVDGILPRPDPSKPTPGNRRVSAAGAARARRYGGA